MEAQEALTQLLGSLVNLMKELAKERKEAKDAYYAELTGRIETMRTVVIFLQQSLQPNPAGQAEKPAEEPKAAIESKPKKGKAS